jgi:hypothetical protein
LVHWTRARKEGAMDHRASVLGLVLGLPRQASIGGVFDKSEALSGYE